MLLTAIVGNIEALTGLVCTQDPQILRTKTSIQPFKPIFLNSAYRCNVEFSQENQLLCSQGNQRLTSILPTFWVLLLVIVYGIPIFVPFPIWPLLLRYLKHGRRIWSHQYSCFLGPRKNFKSIRIDSSSHRKLIVSVNLPHLSGSAREINYYYYYYD